MTDRVVCLFVVSVLLLSGLALADDFTDGISICGDNICVKKEPSEIKGVGYAPWRPGQYPGLDAVDDSLIDEDFRRIAEAGFNTVRTWDALTAAQLKLAAKHGLYVIQGIWLDPAHDFLEPSFQSFAVQYIRKVVTSSKGFDNVLMYLLITEPRQEAVLYASEQKTMEFFKIIKQTVQEIDNKPVSMDSWIPIGFMDHSIWDVITFNVFEFEPGDFVDVLGFKNYVSWIKKNHALNKPLLIGETGGFSVSPTVFNEHGFGGNSQTVQAQRNIRNLKDALKAGAAGTVLVAWADTWHYPSDPMTHNDHPWEWDGIIEYKSIDDRVGTPREQFNELKKFNAVDKRISCEPEQEHDLANFISIDGKADFHSDDKEFVFNLNVKENAVLQSDKLRVDICFFLPASWEQERKSFLLGEGTTQIKCTLRPQIYEQYLLAAVSCYDDDKRIGYDIYFFNINGVTRADDRSFYVYYDNFSPRNHFYPTGYGGDFQDIKADTNHKSKVYSGTSSISVTYMPKAEGATWSGIDWQFPIHNWSLKNGYSLRGYQRLRFKLCGARGGETVGYVGFRDATGKRYTLSEVTLTEDWTDYSIDCSDADFSTISTGFFIQFTQSQNPQGCTVLIDDVFFE